MSGDNLCRLTIQEAAPMLQRREISPVELTEAFLARIEELNQTLAAYVCVTSDLARTQAKQAEQEIGNGQYRGPMHGVPIGLKDIYATKGIATTASSHLHVNRIPDADAEATARLAAAGAVLLGKLTTHEFAFGGPSWDLPTPPARNPWNPDHFTGGSSSGSGAAAAAGLAMGTLGSDTAGSIRMPAFFCGIAGLKPTYGRVSRRGVTPLAFSLDHCGPMTWSVADCALMMNAIAGYDPIDPASANLPVPDHAATLDDGVKGKRIGLIKHFYDGDIQAAEPIKLAMAAAAKTFESLGAHVEEVTLPSLRDFHACNFVIMLAEAYAIHQASITKTPEKYGEILRDRMMLASFITGYDYVQATRMRTSLKAAVDTALSKYDFLLTAGGPTPAPKLEQMPKFYVFENPLLTSPFNVSGHPVLSVCNGFSDAKLPVGMQIVGRPFDEAGVLAAGQAFEQATPFRNERPMMQ